MTTHQFPLHCSEIRTHTWRLEIVHLVPYCSWSQNAPSKCNGKTPDLRRMERRRHPQGCSAPGVGFVVEGTAAQLSIQLLSHVLDYQWLCPWWEGSFPEDFPGWGEYWLFFVSNDFFLVCLVLPDLSDDFHSNERWLKRGCHVLIHTYGYFPEDWSHKG